MDFSNKYVMGFAFAICLVCSGVVSFFAVALNERQEANKILDQQRQVIRVAQLAPAGDKLNQARVDELFKDIVPRVINRATGEFVDIPVTDVDPLKMAKDPDTSIETPSEFKGAQVKRLPSHLEVCLLYTSPSPRDRQKSRMPSSA